MPYAVHQAPAVVAWREREEPRVGELRARLDAQVHDLGAAPKLDGARGSFVGDEVVLGKRLGGGHWRRLLIWRTAEPVPLPDGESERGDRETARDLGCYLFYHVDGPDVQLYRVAWADAVDRDRRQRQG